MDTPSHSSNSYADIVTQSEWCSDVQELANQIPEAWLPWLEDQGSLTSALMAFSNENFRVNVLSEHWSQPLPWEAKKLGIPLELDARIREVELLCHEEVMVYARSIIPLSMFEAEAQTFKGMGSKPLGHLLFKDGRARNRQRSYAIYRKHDLESEDGSESAQTILGRSTPYEYHGGEILVSEFFVNPSLIEPEKQ